MSDLVSAALRGDFSAARNIHYRFLPLLTGNFIESNPGPVKCACKLLGIIEDDGVRPPLAPVTAASRTKLETILHECGLVGEEA
jgi:4-hydroxy-tetrahydrodipicolinate synthase